jgi:hypothetical protein
MTTNNKIVNKLTRSAALKAAHNNARRRLKRSEKRYKAAEAASDAANDAADQARYKAQRLFGELMLSMNAVDSANPHKTKDKASHMCVDPEMSMPMSTLAANKVAEFLSSMNMTDAMEDASSAS